MMKIQTQQPIADIIYAACANPEKMLQSGHTPGARRKLGSQIKASIREAKKYFVDEEVTRCATALGVQHPDILMSMLRRARLPVAKCFVEWDNHAQTSEGGSVVADDAPPRVGCLIERLHESLPIFRLTVMGILSSEASEDGGKNRISVSPISVVYNLNEPVSQSEHASISKIANLPEDYIRKSLIGGAYMERGAEHLDEEEIEHRRKLCDNLSTYASNVISPWFKPVIAESLSGSNKFDRKALEDILSFSVIEHSGTWRFIISLFALINARNYTESDSTHRVAKSRMVGAQVVPYLDHQLVKLKLPRKIVERKMLKEMADAIPKRRHMVEGHFAQSRKKGLPNCEHIYVSETPRRDVCIVEGCGHKVWFVDEHYRGDAALGIVIKDRYVTRN